MSKWIEWVSIEVDGEKSKLLGFIMFWLIIITFASLSVSASLDIIEKAKPYFQEQEQEIDDYSWECRQRKADNG